MQTVLTICGILIPVLATIWATISNRRKKKLSYSISSSTLISEGEEFRDKLHISVEGQEVKGNVYLVLLQIFNNGNVPIEPSDFINSLSVKTEGDLLVAELKDEFPKELGVRVQKHESEANQLNIAPLLLNKGDAFTLKLLSTSSEENLKIPGRIVGVKKIEKYTPPIIEPKERLGVFKYGFLITIGWMLWLNGFDSSLLLEGGFLRNIGTAILTVSTIPILSIIIMDVLQRLKYRQT